MTLADKLLAIHTALERGAFEHAFGGAIALAYWTLEPRGTSDIDVNIFVPATSADAAIDTLPSGIARDEAAISAIAETGQARLWWDETPIDLFFDYDQLHGEAARHRKQVPFAGSTIPILGPIELASFKAAFDRTKDWADIEAMLVAETLDPDGLQEHLLRLVGPDDDRLDRLAEAIRRADRTAAER